MTKERITKRVFETKEYEEEQKRTANKNVVGESEGRYKEARRR